MTTQIPTTVTGQSADPNRNRPRPAPAEAAADPTAEQPADTVPAYTASGRPVTRAERFVFQLWIVCALLTLVVTLLFFLVDKFRQ
ncbi:MAG TPA: hypothetical protein VM597_27710 [Gemmataceae bacterium]|jgi:hypothetical protein|nr:hypothetical protein [Gemmataceae bacterium]